MKHCTNCGCEMPDWDVHDVCEDCDREIYNNSKAIAEQESGQAEAEAYERYCEEQQGNEAEVRW